MEIRVEKLPSTLVFSLDADTTGTCNQTTRNHRLSLTGFLVVRFWANARLLLARLHPAPLQHHL